MISCGSLYFFCGLRFLSPKHGLDSSGPNSMKTREFNKFESTLLKKDKPDFRRNLRIVEALYQEAIAFSAFPFDDPLHGLDVDLRIAKVVNCVPKAA